MPTLTANYSLLLPLVDDPTDEDLWGDQLNEDITDIDALLRTGITNPTQASQTVSFNASSSISEKSLYPCDATAAPIIATIPLAAAAGNGSTVTIKKTDASANSVTLARSGADTIDGATSVIAATQNQGYTIVSDGVDKWYSQARTGDLPAFRSIATQQITATGTYTPTVGMLYCKVEGVAPGGGSGGGAGASGFSGGGGGAGEEGFIYASAATIGASQAVTIGAVGAAGAIATSGTAGGDAVFGALLTLKGGSGGVGQVATTSPGGDGGTGGSGGTRRAGNPGLPGIGASTQFSQSGQGGCSSYGAGGKATANSGTAVVGNAGKGFGAGASGGVAAAVGAAGSGGMFLITEYIA